MKLYGKYVFNDLLEDGEGIMLDGLLVDTHVEVVISLIEPGVIEIDSSTFGEKDVYILPPGGTYQVKISQEGNPVFFRKLEQAIDELALKMAAELPETVWFDNSLENY